MLTMGFCFSKFNEGRKKGRKGSRGNGKFYDFDKEWPKRQKSTDANRKKSRSRKLSSDDSSTDSSSSDSDHRLRVRSTKEVRRGKNGGIAVITNKTVIGGDNITIGEGSKIVNVTIGSSRSNRRSGGRKDRDKNPSSDDQDMSKPNFSKLKPRREQGAQQLPACFMQLTDRSEPVADLEILLKASESVGKIHASDNFCATVFRVGPSDIMTCKHVVDGIVEKERKRVTDFSLSNRYELLKRESVYVDFGYIHHTDTPLKNSKQANAIFHLTSKVKFEDEEHDVAILELKQKEGIEFPPALTNFSRASPDKKFTFIGHPEGKPKQHNKVDGPVSLDDDTYERAFSWSMRVYGSDGFIGARRPERMLFHCSFQHGGSGSPGVAVESGKKPVVVTMLLRGYPEWYYCQGLDTQIKERVAPDQRIEQGVDMVSLYYKMHRENRDLCASVFGQNT